MIAPAFLRNTSTMRRAAGCKRRTVETQCRTWAKMQFMARGTLLRLDSFWQLQILGWGCFYLWALLGNAPDLLRQPGAFREQTVSMTYQFLVTTALRPVCRRLLQQSQSWLAFEWKAGVVSVFAGGLSFFVSERTLHGFAKIDWFGLLPVALSYWFVIFLWCSLYFSIKQWQQARSEKEQLLLAQSEAREARLLALRYQLNPHFLFNSLNSVSTLVLDGKTQAATRMLAQIGDLLRASLDSEILTEVPLSQEIMFNERYLSIEKTRLGDRLKYSITISSDTLNALVPSMLLQPLVENAVRHGVAPLTEGGTIAIKSTLHAGRLRILIENSGRQDTEKHKELTGGIGLKNTTERLEALFGDDYCFSLDWPESGGCRVTVELPFRCRESRKEVLSCAQ